MRLLLVALLALAAATAHGQAPPAKRAAVSWEAPTELRVLFEKHLVPPEIAEGGDARGALRPFVREVNRRVPEIAAAEGWFSPKVETRIEGEGAQAKLLVAVTPGARTTVAKVEIELRGAIAGEGIELDARRRGIRAVWPLVEGRPFRNADWEDAKSRTLDALVEVDYAAARLVESEARVDAGAATASLKIVLDSGPAFTLGELAVSGLARYPATLVARYSDLDPGERYVRDRLLDLQRALQNSAYFNSVVVEIDRDPAKAVRVPVEVTVVERPAVNVGLSLGYGTDSGARGEVSYRHRNVFHRGWDMQSAFALDRTRQIGYADFYLPPRTFGGPFGDEPATRDSLGTLVERTSNQNLVTRRIAFAAYRAFKVDTADYRVGLSYQFERKVPQGAAEELARALAPVASATWRTVDNVLDPTRGGVLNVNVAAAANAFFSDQDFVKLYAQYQHWFPLSPVDQLLLRAEVGQTVAASRSGIPQDFLFRAGGTRSNRGYAYESLGAQEGEAIVGGRYLATASVEYVRWFSREWGGALFVDVGDAADARAELGANASYGFGARWRTPAGPLAFDLAYAEGERKWRVSFSVSVAF